MGVWCTGVYFLLHHILPKPRCWSSRRAAPSWNSAAPPSVAELPLLRILLLGWLPTTLSKIVITMLLMMLIHKMPIMVRLLLRYWCGPFFASSGQPVYSAYVVRTLPKLPSPETRAAAAATPTSPCRRWKISLVQVMQIGTVGPSPNPTISSPP